MFASHPQQLSILSSFFSFILDKLVVMESTNTTMCVHQVEGQSLMETDEQRLDSKQKKKKSHGNRKLQHFKRKCRSRGMTEEQITELLNSRGNENSISSDHSHQKSKKPTNNKRRIDKRKRSDQNSQGTNTTIRSMSQLSLSQQHQPVRKKVKTREVENDTAFSNHNSM